jgi:antitoxin component YwqK of YwqJK toxin-antitoxin module
MKQTLYLLLLIASTAACGQGHEVLVTDTAYVESRLIEDSVKYFVLKNEKNLKGHWIAYYDELKQRKAMEAIFMKRRLTGTERQWYEDGKPLSEKKCENDTCTTDYYYNNGMLMKRDIETLDRKGSRNWFYSATYCDNGQIKYSPPLNPDSRSAQLITSFYCSGTRKEEFTLLLVGAQHLKIGPYSEWFENGAVKTIGYYDDAQPGNKIGFWNYYNAGGNLTKQERYEDGALKESMIY